MTIIDKYYYLVFCLLKKYDKRTFPEFGAAVVVVKSVFIAIFSFTRGSSFSLLQNIVLSFLSSICLVYFLLFRKKRYKRICYKPQVHWWVLLLLFEIAIMGSYILTIQKTL